MLDDGVVACSAGFNDLPRDEVSVYDRERIGRLGEDGRDGRFARRDGACEAEEEHGRLLRLKLACQ